MENASNAYMGLSGLYSAYLCGNGSDLRYMLFPQGSSGQSPKNKEGLLEGIICLVLPIKTTAIFATLYCKIQCIFDLNK